MYFRKFLLYLDTVISEYLVGVSDWKLWMLSFVRKSDRSRRLFLGLGFLLWCFLSALWKMKLYWQISLAKRNWRTWKTMRFYGKDEIDYWCIDGSSRLIPDLPLKLLFLSNFYTDHPNNILLYNLHYFDQFTHYFHCGDRLNANNRT